MALEIRQDRLAAWVAGRILRDLSAGLALAIHLDRLAGLVAGRIPPDLWAVSALDAAMASGCCARRRGWRDIRHSRQ